MVLRTDLFDHNVFSLPADSSKLVYYVTTHFSDPEVSLTYEACCCGFSTTRYFLNMAGQ
ncbi:MAG TPA: hypothetical protein VKI61_11060 [Chitinophagaceae bacterium]|jgi:transposase|nr:hypothetical protein [Chitinophagaceae bacterium]